MRKCGTPLATCRVPHDRSAILRSGGETLPIWTEDCLENVANMCERSAQLTGASIPDLGSLSRSQMLSRRQGDSGDNTIKPFDGARQEARHPIQAKVPARHAPWPTSR